ncbi:DNA repair protein RecO [Clostridium luticellarii]|uniref:DNA repair protein RecO n=1 Tax=Clostridium luticellarii TaxID=1691940 RepID=UPI000D038426|nr:DNA repair protein RecO [Clostridium luticellarii]MCI1944099.1 DNA repair protein RecO [Clostridium luticellarii]MCI1967259.1 DNA repair protein RecO [Clostridium luticellarii]MCI1995170.1 DNA repair protein RecO [Clostridium luticellarii]MCI2039334.1 DNA repair protein RecO [Clostridium luticellarii]
MAIFKTRAVIIKTQDIKESDKLVWLFTEKLGKVSTIARGAKKSRNSLFSTTLQFCYGDYVLYKGKSLYVINESILIDSFQDLLDDLNDLTYASYFCELVDIAMNDGEESEDVFKQLVAAFYLIRSHAVDIEILARSFELKILQATGYGFNFDYCCMCRKKITSFNYFSFQYSGGVCDKCEKVNGMHIDYATGSALKYLSKTSLENVYKVALSDRVKKELYKVLNLVISQNYFRKPKSLDTLRYLENFEKNKI